ncbi:MAG: hypothetical protein HWE27_05625 [Gammaproteobacteria bacterium]|nr:hypothetical protein [Gammaproteobacteria bacterium]
MIKTTLSVFGIFYIAFGIYYSFSVGYFFHNELREAQDKKVPENIQELLNVKIESRRIYICYSRINKKFNIEINLDEIEDVSRKKNERVFNYPVERKDITDGCVERDFEIIPKSNIELLYGLKQNLYKEIANYRSNHKIEVVAIASTDPDTRIKKDYLELVLVHDTQKYVLDIEKRFQEGKDIGIGSYVLAIFKDSLSYPYQLYKLVNSGS